MAHRLLSLRGRAGRLAKLRAHPSGRLEEESGRRARGKESGKRGDAYRLGMSGGRAQHLLLPGAILHRQPRDVQRADSPWFVLPDRPLRDRHTRLQQHKLWATDLLLLLQRHRGAGATCVPLAPVPNAKRLYSGSTCSKRWFSSQGPEAYKPSYQTLSFENTTDGFDRKEVKLESWRLASRVTFSFLVNYVLQQLLVSSLPLMLCSSENYMDFVLNSAATIFIIELDDISGEEVLCHHRLKDCHMGAGFQQGAKGSAKAAQTHRRQA